MLVACVRGLMKECTVVNAQEGDPDQSSRCKKSMVKTKASSNQNASINKKKLTNGGRASSLPLTKYSRINHSKRGFTHFTQLNPEAAFLVCLRYDAGTILETMPKVGDDHRTAFSEKQ
jgi:hypothetical protein